MPTVQISTARKPQVLIVGLILVAATAVTVGFSLLPVPLAAGAVAGVLFLILAIRRPVWGLALLCAILSLEGIAASRLGMTEIRLVGIAAFGIWLIHLVIYGKSLQVDKTFGMALLFLLWTGISLLWTRVPEVAGPYYGTMLQLALLFLMAVNVVESERDFRLIMAALLLGAVGTSFLSLNIFVTNLFERARTFEAQNANLYASVVGLAIIGGLYLTAKLEHRLLRMGSFLLTCYLAFPLILAQSRTAWVSILAALGVYWWHTKNRLRNMIIVLSVFSGIIISIFATGLVNITVIDRVGELLNLQQRGSPRFDIWRVAVNVIYEHPLVGVGFMQFPVVYNRYRADTYGIRQDLFPGRDPHNVYLGVAAELGVVGLVLLLLIFWKAWHEENLPAGLAPWISKMLLIYIIVFSTGGSVIRDKFFWVALALAVKAHKLAAMEYKGKQEEA